MAIIAPSTPTRKAPPVYRAHVYDEPGALAKIEGIIYFFSDSGTITEVEPTDCPWITILGQAALAETQAILDRLHGGAAAVCTSRAMEVR